MNDQDVPNPPTRTYADRVELMASVVKENLPLFSLTVKTKKGGRSTTTRITIVCMNGKDCSVRCTTQREFLCR